MTTRAGVLGTEAHRRPPATASTFESGDALFEARHAIIVAARSELFTVPKIAGEDLRKTLEASSNRTASDLVAIEIVWQPAEENDRLSSMELKAKYPRPDLIPITNALVGQTFCTYCGGRSRPSSRRAPHCGAPAREDQSEVRAA